MPGRKSMMKPVGFKLTKLFTEFFQSEQASGAVLIGCTVLAILIANSPFGAAFIDFWHYEIGFEIGNIPATYSLEHWINDGLMAIFFLLIGLEIERELYIGELSDFRNASLPLFAAIGGMAMPALIYLFINRGSVMQNGFGIPMATDIAFALGVIALLGTKVPAPLKVFVTAFAIIDDVGAIFVIALFYVGDFSFYYLLLAFSLFGLLLIFNRLRIQHLGFYFIPGALMWYFMLRSGVHATLAGVLLAFAIPFGDGGEDSPSYRLQHMLHKPVAFGILPLFALANTGVMFTTNWAHTLLSTNSIGVFAGLLLGKPLGIVLACFMAIKTRLAKLPGSLSWIHIVGAGFLGGIGFTMSIFITLLAFQDPALVQGTKIVIMLSSLLAGTIGYLILSRAKPNAEAKPMSSS